MTIKSVIDYADRILKVWDLATREEAIAFVGESCFSSCAVSPDGKTIVAGDYAARVHFLRMEGV